MRWGVATARRAWLTAADVANTRPWAELASAAQAGAAAARSATSRSTRLAAERLERRAGAARVVGAADRRAPCAGAPARSSPTSRASSSRAIGSAAYGPGAGVRDELAAVGERLELGDPVVLAARRAHEHARAPQQRPVVLRRAARRRRARLGSPARAGRRARARSPPTPRHDELLAPSPAARARHRAPRREHAVETLLARVGGVRDRRDVALATAAQAGPRARPRPARRAPRAPSARRGRRLAQRPLAPRQQQRRLAQAAALERALPEPVASGPVAGGRRVEADRARRAATAARRSCSSRSPRRPPGRRRCRATSRAAARAARAHAEIGEHQRARRARGAARGRPSRSRRPVAASPRAPRLRACRPAVEPSETISTSSAPAAWHRQVTAPLVRSGRSALNPGVRSSAIGRSGEVRRT